MTNETAQRSNRTPGFPVGRGALQMPLLPARGELQTGLSRWRFGENSTLAMILSTFTSLCPWDPHNPTRKPQKYGMKCGAYCPDIGRN